MSPLVALLVLTWVALAVCFMALAAVMREVRLLRGQVESLGWREAPAASLTDLQLPPDVVSGRERLVLAADSGCPLCQYFAHHLADRAADLGDAPVLLTHEQPQVWDHLPDGLQVVSDQNGWRAIAHLSPPVMLRVAANGRVEQMSMPTTLEELDQNLADWRTGAAAPAAKERP